MINVLEKNKRKCDGCITRRQVHRFRLSIKGKLDKFGFIKIKSFSLQKPR